MEIKTFKNIIAEAPVISLAVLICTLPFYYGTVQRIALIAFFSLFVLDYVVNQRYKNFVWKSQKWLFLAFALFFISTFFWDFELTQHVLFQRVINHRMPYVGFAIVAILGLSDRFRLPFFAYISLLSAALIILFLLIKFGFNPTLPANVPWVEAIAHERILHVHSHMVTNMYFNMALISAFYLLMRRSVRVWNHIIVIVLALIVCFGLFISEGRSGQFVGFSIVACALFVFAWRLREWLILPAFLLICGMAISLLSFNKRIQTSLDDSRFVLWRVAFEMIEKKPLLGYGIVDGRAKYVDYGLCDEEFCTRYADYAMQTALFDVPDKYSMSPHNAYLDTLLQSGILGLLIFLTTLVVPIFYSTPNKFFLLLVIFAFSVQCMFDTIGPNLQSLSYVIWVCLWCQGNNTLVFQCEKRPNLSRL